MAKFQFVHRKIPGSSLTPATVPVSLVTPSEQPEEQKVTVYTTAGSLQAHIYNLLISLAAVLIMAALQAALTYMQQIFPNLSTGASQIGAAFVAVKFLGQ